jgi:hypothetical protein
VEALEMSNVCETWKRCTSLSQERTSTHCVAFKYLPKNFDPIFCLWLFAGQSEVFPSSDTAELNSPTFCGRMLQNVAHGLGLGLTLWHYVSSLLSSCLLSKNIKSKIYRTVILPVVLYGYKAWPRTLREEHRLRVFDNRVLRRIFEHKRDEVTGEWRRLRNEELNDLYSSPNIIRVIKSRGLRWAGSVAHMGRGQMHTGFCGETQD